MDSQFSVHSVNENGETKPSVFQKFKALVEKNFEIIEARVREYPWEERFAQITRFDMADVKEFLKLLCLNLVVQKRNLVEYLHVVAKYYPQWAFAKVDLSIILMYFFHNPFSISKRFLQKRGEVDVYAYGETPLTTLDLIAKECALTSEDRVYELGCGRGRTCFWLEAFLGCQVVGIEFIPDFVERAHRIQRKIPNSRVLFRVQDMLESDLSDATVIYLYGTCYDDAFLHKLTTKFKQLKSGTRIISVSYPLNEFSGDDSFEVMKRFPALFTWGEGDVYYQVKK